MRSSARQPAVPWGVTIMTMRMNLEKNRIVNICDRVSFFSLCVVALFLPVSKGAIESFSIAAIVFYLVGKLISFEDIVKTPVNLTLFVYLSICVVSIFMSSNLKISARTFFAKTLQDAAFFFVVVETLNSKRRFKNILYILFFSSFILGVDGIYQYFTHKDFLRHRPVIFVERIYASFATPNSFGCYLSVIISFVAAQLFRKRSFKFSKIIYGSLFILLFVCLTLTVSRGAWFAFLGSTLFLSIWIHGLGVFFLILGIVMVTIQPFCHPFIKERLANFFIFSDSGSMDRQFIWRAGWKMFISNPWIGVGLGTFMFNFKSFIIADYKYTAAYAHNCYLQMASEMGIIGLLAFLSILAVFFYQGIKALKSQERSFHWYILLASLAGILGYCVQMGVDTILYSLDLGMLFWLVLGMGVAASRNLEAESGKKKTAPEV